MKIKPADRIGKSNYLIAEYIAEISKARYLHGDRMVVDMSMGNPDIVPAKSVQETLRQKIGDIWSHRYNNPKGDGVLFHTVMKWFKERFGVDINPRTEIMATSGSSDAIDHIFTAFANVGDKILIPNPGYSQYDDLIVRHDLEKVPYDTDLNNNCAPDFSKMPTDAKILILNYPNNPTGSFGTTKIFRDAVNFARKHNMLIIHDMDNSEITHTGRKPIGIMQIDGAKDVAFQVHTFSKAQSMPGFRVAFAVSAKDNIDYLLRAKYLSGGSVYIPVQHAAAAALRDEDGFIERVNKIYRNRKNTAVKMLNELGSDATATDGTYYLWVKIPDGFTSDEFFKYTLHKSGVAFTPGTVFGSNGEGYVRIVMTAKEDVIKNSFEKIAAAGIRFDVPKQKLATKLKKEIAKMADNSYKITPKEDRDFADYMKYLKKLADTLTKRFASQDKRFKAYIPQVNSSLPWNLLKDGYYLYLQNQGDGESVFARIYDIPPFSPKRDYDNFINKIKSDWLTTNNAAARILPVYKNGITYPDAHYFILEYDNKIQAIANLELQNDGIMWIRGMNTAPWNMGADKTFAHCGLSIMARIVSFALERNITTIKLAPDKDVAEFYSRLGMQITGQRVFDGEPRPVFEFDTEGMKHLLNRFQVNLSF